jgi:hypothetical protein
MFHSGRKEVYDSNISFSYETVYFIFGSRRFYEKISFVFHFVITQYIKNRCVLLALAPPSLVFYNYRQQRFYIMLDTRFWNHDGGRSTAGHGTSTVPFISDSDVQHHHASTAMPPAQQERGLATRQPSIQAFKSPAT